MATDGNSNTMLRRILFALMNNGASGYAPQQDDNILLRQILFAIQNQQQSGGGGVPTGPAGGDLNGNYPDPRVNGLSSLFDGSGGNVAQASFTEQTVSAFFDNGTGYGTGVDFALANAVNAPNGLVEIQNQGLVIVYPRNDGYGTFISLNNESGVSGNDWGIANVNNGISTAPAGAFCLFADPGSLTPFVVELGAPASSLYVSSTGLVSSVTGFSGDGSNLTGTANSLVVGEAESATYSSTDSQVLHGTDGSTSGLAVFQANGSIGTTGAAAAIQAAVPSTGGNFSGTGTATTSFSVTFGTVQADANYTIGVTPRNTLSSAVFNVSAKSTTGFTVTYLTGLTGTVAFDWSLTRW